jgi:hypothetical protein
MVSRDGQMFACGASPNQHDHFTADYDIFVARMDPKTLEVIDEPVRYSFHPGCDRFPDVFLASSKLAAKGGAVTPTPNASNLEAVRWPTNREGLVYLFETGDKPNQVPSVNGRPERGYTIRPRSRARLDHNYAMVIAGGSFLAGAAEKDLLEACRASNQLTVEAFIRPDRLDHVEPARIVTFSSSAYTRNFTLAQEQDRLVFRLRTPSTGENGVNPQTTLCTIPAGQTLHIVATYRPGRITGFVDGKEVYRGDSVQGDLSNWELHHLLFGDEFDGNRNWSGTLEGVAIYNRALDSPEIRENATTYHNLTRARKPVPQIEVLAKLVAKSQVPTLKEIKPYREALFVCKYRVTEVARGSLPDKEVLVAQWALLDGQLQPVTSLAANAAVRMILEPSDANRQLKRFVCKDDFDGEGELLSPRYYDATP